MPSKVPYPFQREAIELGKDHNLMIAHGTGLGKTLTCIEIGKAFGGRRLIISPKGTRSQWRSEIEGQDPGSSIRLLERSDDLALPPVQWEVIHFEPLLDLVLVDEETKAFSLNLESPWLPILKIKWGFIAIDESHRIKSRKAQRSWAIAKLKTSPSGRIVEATGTPWDKSPAELWHQLKVLYPKKYTSFHRFKDKYVEFEVGWGGHVKDIGPKVENLPLLAEELAGIVHHRTVEDVLPDLPPNIETALPVQLDKRHKKLYDDLRKVKGLLAQIEDEKFLIKSTMAHIMKLHRLAGDPSLLGVKALNGAKLDFILEWVKDHPNEKVIIFSAYRPTAIELATKLKSALLVGRREEKLDDFKFGEVNQLVGTLGAMSESYNFPMASTNLFLNCSWDATMMTQAKGRVRRMGITETKNTIYLLAESTVDYLYYETFTKKLSDTEMVWEFLRREDQ